MDGALHCLVELAGLCTGGSAPEHEAHEDEEEQGLVGEAAGGVEHYVGKKAGAVGQECLMDLVSAGNEDRCAHGHGVSEEAGSQRVAHADGGVAEGDPESAEADEREHAVAVEVADFAQDVVGKRPLRAC